MDFSKYLPKYLIIKNVLNIYGVTTHHFLLLKSLEINPKFLNSNSILSWHPLIIKDSHNFYYFKGIKHIDYLLINFCQNNTSLGGEKYNETILENYFNKNSFEL